MNVCKRNERLNDERSLAMMGLDGMEECKGCDTVQIADFLFRRCPASRDDSAEIWKQQRSSESESGRQCWCWTVEPPDFI